MYLHDLYNVHICNELLYNCECIPKHHDCIILKNDSTKPKINKE